jgi:hypothetical protein
VNSTTLDQIKATVGVDTTQLVTLAQENPGKTAFIGLLIAGLGFETLSQETQDAYINFATRTVSNIGEVALATVDGALSGVAESIAKILTVIPDITLSAAEEGGQLADAVEGELSKPNVIQKKQQIIQLGNTTFLLPPRLWIESPVKKVSEIAAGTAAFITSTATFALLATTAYYFAREGELPKNLDFFEKTVVTPIVEGVTEAVQTVGTEGLRLVQNAADAVSRLDISKILPDLSSFFSVEDFAHV